MTAYSSARSRDPNIIVIHTGEGILDADDMVRFLDNNPNASAHAAADADHVAYGGVPDNRAAWTAGPTANDRGLHIELCAFAQMTRAEWLSEEDVRIFVPWIGDNGAWRTIRKPRQMLRNAAAWVRAKADAHVIHLRKVNQYDLRAGVDGICGHADTSDAWGETDHTDPGLGFPWDVFLDMAWGREQKPGKDEDDMFTDGDREALNHLAWRVKSFLDVVSPVHNDPNAPRGEEVQASIDLNQIKWHVDDLLHMKPVGSRDRVEGEEYELIAYLQELGERLTAIEHRIGLGRPEEPGTET